MRWLYFVSIVGWVGFAAYWLAERSTWLNSVTWLAFILLPLCIPVSLWILHHAPVAKRS